MALSEVKVTVPHEIIDQVFGAFDSNIKIIEKELDVQVVDRGDGLKVSGEPERAKMAEKVLMQLVKSAGKGIEIGDQHVNYTIDMVKTASETNLDQIKDDYICMTTRGKYIRPKTAGQSEYIEAIKNKMIVFGVGPAGTGKTYLAMAHAITAFKKKEVNRIIMTRPAIEAGEKLGFLPGDLQSKVDPYLRPLYDALYEIMGADAFVNNMEKGLIEVAPLAYMRGRTLDNAFIVLDEAQNTTPEQMKMFLTRIGYGSKAIITGDITQKDLPDGKISGLETAIRILSGIEEIGIVKLTHADVVRHPVVQKIVKAYEQYDQKRQEKNKPQDKNRPHKDSGYRKTPTNRRKS